MSDPNTPVKVIKKAFDALEFIAEKALYGNGASLSEIADYLGIAATTTRNILKTMEFCGYVGRNAERQYCPGEKCFSMMRLDLAAGELQEAARGAMEALAAKTGESLVLTTMLFGKRHVLMRSEGASLIQVRSEWFEQKNVYTTVTMRVMLAFASELELRKAITRYGYPQAHWEGIDDDSSLQRHLDEIRALGYAEEVGQECAQIAFPICCGNGLLGALGMYLPAFRYTPERRGELQGMLRESVREIEDSLSV